jgi:hypothetical protein
MRVIPRTRRLAATNHFTYLTSTLTWGHKWNMCLWLSTFYKLDLIWLRILPGENGISPVACFHNYFTVDPQHYPLVMDNGHCSFNAIMRPDLIAVLMFYAVWLGIAWPVIPSFLRNWVTQIAMKFLTFYGTRRFTTAFTRACHRSYPEPNESSPHLPTLFP